MKQSDKAMISTYINSAIAAAVALYMSGNTDPNDLLGAAIAAVAPLAIGYVNPKNRAYGLGKAPDA
jgi:hypothetical protein